MKGLNVNEHQTNLEQLELLQLVITGAGPLSLGAEIRTFPKQAKKCMDNHLYLAACLCFITGVESGLRYLLNDFDDDGTIAKLSKGNINNFLIRKVGELGVDITVLKLVGNDYFDLHCNDAIEFDKNINDATGKKLNSNDKPVGIVKLRNDLCHGNLEFAHKFHFHDDSSGRSSAKTIEMQSLEAMANLLNNISDAFISEIEKLRRPDYF
ncbi:hypothetical protein ABHF33_12940 [Chitinibacter sp. FCG-7]|uniref:MAE-28990/MAE-18760-like HEPN domain-containing protein n=1 Tax=Chitinibacter mangrovi TaxID=3153927 RepID=A0AAU7F7F0_9NEIS